MRSGVQKLTSTLDDRQPRSLCDLLHVGRPLSAGERQHGIRAALAQHPFISPRACRASVTRPVGGELNVVDTIPPCPVTCDSISSACVTLDYSVDNALALQAIKGRIDPLRIREIAPATNKKSHRAALALLATIALGACASKPEIAINSYCSVKATELIDLRDPGLQRLTPVNQGAVLTGDDSWNRFCKGAVNKGR